MLVEEARVECKWRSESGILVETTVEYELRVRWGLFVDETGLDFAEGGEGGV